MVVPGKFFGEEFQRHRATQPGVLGLIDDAHSSLAQLLKDSKMRNGLSDHDWRRSLLLAGHVRPWPLASQTTATPNPWFPLTYCQRECPPNIPRERMVLQLRVSAQDDDVRKFLRNRGTIVQVELRNWLYFRSHWHAEVWTEKCH